MARIEEVGSRKKLSVQFDSVNQVFRAIDKFNWVPQHSKSSNKYEGSDFHTFHSLAEARDIFENHPETIRNFSTLDDRLTSVDSPGIEVEYDVTGDYVDVGRYLEGIPEVMGAATMGNPRTVFCTINILLSYVYYTKPEYQIAKQKRVLRLVDWLEQRGVRCQIVMTDDSDTLYSSITVKEFADPFDLNDLTVVMHPDWLRRIMFLLIEQSKTFEYGYGDSVSYDKRMKKYKPNPEDGMYVYVGGYLPFKGSNNGIDELDAAFDKIEADILELINNNQTYNEDPLVVTGAVGW